MGAGDPMRNAAGVPRSLLVGLALFAVCAILLAMGVLMLQQGPSFGHTRIGGPFALSDTEGRPVTQSDLLGKPTAILFGFTYCPEVCPTTLTKLTGALGRMGATADRLNVVFVTVDPERDTAKDMKAYLEAFDPRIRGFTGTPGQVEAVMRAYRVHARRVPVQGGYTMEHTATIMLFDAAGREVGGIDYGEDEAALIGKLTSLALPGTCRPGAPGSLWEASVTRGTAAGACN